jgi:hypothetical protein
MNRKLTIEYSWRADMYHAELKAKFSSSLRVSEITFIEHGKAPLDDSLYKAFMEWYT